VSPARVVMQGRPRTEGVGWLSLSAQRWTCVGMCLNGRTRGTRLGQAAADTDRRRWDVGPGQSHNSNISAGQRLACRSSSTTGETCCSPHSFACRGHVRGTPRCVECPPGVVVLAFDEVPVHADDHARVLVAQPLRHGHHRCTRSD